MVDIFIEGFILNFKENQKSNNKRKTKQGEIKIDGRNVEWSDWPDSTTEQKQKM